MVLITFTSSGGIVMCKLAQQETLSVIQIKTVKVIVQKDHLTLNILMIRRFKPGKMSCLKPAKLRNNLRISKKKINFA